ncbi:hypothetical protein BLOT_007011 [Blomia tropicalis]|nr:hypothetical protein BLOT_007011 [Blomia tropicalis]
MVRSSIAFKSRINNNWSANSKYWYTKLNVCKKIWYDVPVNSNQESTTIGHQKQVRALLAFENKVANERIQLVPDNDNDEMDVGQGSTSVTRSQRAPWLDPAIRLSGN